MYKIRNIYFKNHPILNDLHLNFCDSDGNAVDTVIIAGENGTGKSTVLDFLYNIISEAQKLDQLASKVPKFKAAIEIEENGAIHTLEYFDKVVNYSHGLWVKDESGWSTIPGNPEFKNKYPITGIFSDVDINFIANKMTSVTSLTLDENNNGRRSGNNLPEQIKQLLIDIQALDDAELARAYRIAKSTKSATDELHSNERMIRFTNAFERMFNGLTYSRIENIKNYKQILFKKYGCDIPIDNLSSGEKQIVYRGCFLLKDINALNGTFVFIDEPEISLHPMWQKKILDYYKDIFTDQNGQQTSQIFIVTHSPFIIHNENRKNDKVIVLARNENGNIIAKDKPEYYMCSSIKAVQDAFSLKGFSAETPTVYLEGRTDEKYFNKAIEVFGCKIPFRFKWVGYLDDNGQEVNTGKDSVKKAAQFLIAQNLSIKNVCLLDCDAKHKTESRNNVTIESIPSYENSKDISIGIENALALDTIDVDQFRTSKDEIDGYGGKKTIPSFEKMEFCNYICGLSQQEQSVIFAHLKEIIDHLITLF